MARQPKRFKAVTVRHAQDALAILFPTVKCTVAPNGVPEIWVKDSEGYGFALTLSSGKAGVSATIRKFPFSNPVSVSGNTAGEMACIPMVDAYEISACVYRSDEWSQKFKAWYASDLSPDGTHAVPYPGDKPEVSK